jgi:predicted nucleic acid-binding protein
VLRGAEASTLRVSDLTVVEIAGALARLARMGHLVGDARRVQHALDAHLGRGLERLAVAAHHHDLAAELLLHRPALGLRTNDALHLAVAADHHETLMTLDQRFLEAARALGLDASDAGLLGDRR